MHYFIEYPMFYDICVKKFYENNFKNFDTLLQILFQSLFFFRVELPDPTLTIEI